MPPPSMTPESVTTVAAHSRLRRIGKTFAAKTRRGIAACLGPGLITGASDDDPSGVATYSQAGATHGYSMLWLVVLTLPLMAAIQEICARIGRTTGRGLARNMRLHYPRLIVYPAVFIVVVANTINLGADIGAMGEAVRLLTGGPPWLRLLYALLLTLASLLLLIFASYQRYTSILKYVTVALLVYVATAFFLDVPWTRVARSAFVPDVHFTATYIALMVGVLGTTISPYLFFWQASLESEEVKITPGKEPLRERPDQAPDAHRRIRLDTYIGMAFSNLIAFFIIVCTAATLHAHGHTDIATANDAARALEPLAGRFAEALFAIGILSGGLLAIPSLAGSAAYAVGELMKWPVGLDRKPTKARGFYAVITLATLLGTAVIFSPIDPIKALVWAAVINGLASVPIMIMLMLMFSNRKIMGELTQGTRLIRLIGWLATLAMLAAAIAFFFTR